MIAAVLFDLDDTLYPQASWLRGAWVSVARAAAASGVDPEAFDVALARRAAAGSDGGRVIDGALADVLRPDIPVAPLVQAMREHRSGPLACYPHVRAGLAALRGRVPIGLVTDGDPAMQRDKLRGLALEDAFDVVVLSDELGRDHRKPDPLPFRTALSALGLPAEVVVYVGDRPDKDVAGAQAVGMRAIRVHTGEHAEAPDVVAPWRDVADAAAALELLAGELRGATGISAPGEVAGRGSG